MSIGKIIFVVFIISGLVLAGSSILFSWIRDSDSQDM